MTIHNSEKAILEETVSYIQNLLINDRSGHDWWHIHRVWKTALYIAKHEKANLFVVQIAALLHDISDWKFHGGDELANSQAAYKMALQVRYG